MNRSRRKNEISPFKVGEIRERLFALLYGLKRTDSWRHDLECPSSKEKYELKTDKYDSAEFALERYTLNKKTKKRTLGGFFKSTRDDCHWHVIEKMIGEHKGVYFYKPVKARNFQAANYKSMKQNSCDFGGTISYFNIAPIHQLESILVRKDPSLEEQVSAWFDLLPNHWQAHVLTSFFKTNLSMEEWLKVLEDLTQKNGCDSLWAFLAKVRLKGS